MKIRRAVLQDSYQAVDAMNRSLEGIDNLWEEVTSNPVRRWLSLRVSLPAYFHWFNEGWVLEEEGVVVGWLYLLHHSRSTHINLVAVQQEYRRRRFGSRLLAWTEQRALLKGKEVLTLAVSATNTTARSFYAKHDFKAVHHDVWKGNSKQLPLTSSHLYYRELELPQRPGPFYDLWARALEADRLPVRALVEDQAGYWYSKQGRAWEVWREQQRVAYADLVDDILRVLVERPEDAILLQGAWSALYPEIRNADIQLDLGSRTADEAVRSLLQGHGWVHSTRDRVLMVKEVGTGHSASRLCQSR